MKKINLADLPEFLSQVLSLTLEPVLQQTSNGDWVLYFQREDVGFPFKEFHYSVVEGNKLVERSISDWLNAIRVSSAGHLKVDLRRSIQVQPYPIPGDVHYQCQSCDYEGPRSKFYRPRNVLDRIAVGEPFSDSECPKCSALAHPARDDQRVGLAVMHVVMRKLDEALSSQPQEEACFDIAKLAAHLVSLGSSLADKCSLEILEEMK